jgi:hypothetical protein
VDDNQLILALKGDRIDLEDFAHALKLFSDLLHNVTRAIPEGEHVRWRTEVKPSSVHVAAIAETDTSVGPKPAQHAVRTIRRGFRAIEDQEHAPRYFRERDLRSVKEFAKMDATVVIGSPDELQPISDRTAENVDALLAPSIHAYGTVEGILQSVSSRQGKKCRVYDRHFDCGVECILTDEILNQALDAFDSRVLVYGRIRYKDEKPESIRVERFRKFADPSTLPNADYVKGILRDDWVPPNERR